MLPYLPKAQAGRRVSIHFDAFSISVSSGCEDHYVNMLLDGSTGPKGTKLVSIKRFMSSLKQSMIQQLTISNQ